MLVKKEVNETNKYRGFKQIVSELYNEQMREIEESKKTTIEPINIETKLIYDKYTNSVRAEFKIGNERMYKLKNLSEFYERMQKGESYKYGSKLEFEHKKENFKKEDQQLLEFILKQSEIIKLVNSEANANYRYYGKALSENYILLNNSSLDELLEILQEKEVLFQKEYEDEIIEITDREPDLKFIIQMNKKNEFQMKINKEIDILKDIEILHGKDFEYILYNKKLYKCNKQYENSNLKLIKLIKENFISELVFSKNELPELFSVIMPKFKNSIKFYGVDEKEIEQYKPKKLGVKMFLDFDPNGHILAETKFCYGEEEFNPLQEEIHIKHSRDVVEENKVINILKKTGFMYYASKECFILPDDDKIYNFLSNDINEYMKNFEIMVTDEFKKKEIRQPQIGSIGVRIENDLLSINLENLNIDLKELEEIMNKYNLKKKYHKLKDGRFIDLRENQDLEFLDKMISGLDISYKEIKNGNIKLPVNRTLYLNQILKKIDNKPINKNGEFKKMVNDLNQEIGDEDIKIPSSVENILRHYQKTGYKWLKTLDNYKFGGILADDMGLGKTIQMLSIIAGYVEESNDQRASIVICPSSLTLNWENEAKKFTNKLKTFVIRGSAQERKEQILKANEYDLLITSYDSLKRDIEVYKENKYKFRFAIADEAQYLKNSNTQNAKVVKEILADTRYALTGTPIENSLSELWSIFDYIMPGYLYGYKKFKTQFEMPIVRDNSQQAMDKLKMLIEPFVLRRTKKQVLTELPEKTITVLKNKMKEEQEKIYLDYLAQAKQEVAETISTRGFERSHMQVLSALTRLRQICCHPSLFIKNYNDGSSKLEQCIEILKEATSSGHKILLFSGYTSMFELIEKELKENDITYFKLTGSTKLVERIRMVDEFNTNSDVKVFLISLKAGGTGLNLTGADVVIHYDPWWNASAENQATDRAYRIGQKNNVQVYKLITQNSIEEKIFELQQKKAHLIDTMLDTKSSFISKLSKEDIMKLFE